MSRSPGPWEVRSGKSTHVSIYIEGTAHNVAVGVKRGDADFIVKACNYNQDLVESLQGFLARFGATALASSDTSLAKLVFKARTALGKVQSS